MVGIAETLERYSCATVHPDAMFWATARELGDEAIDLSSLPALSDEEYGLQQQTLRRVSDTEPIRWAGAWSVTRGRRVFVPAVMAWSALRTEHRAERITYPISTGNAVHTDLHAALINALCECVERDADAVLWLRRLPVPRLELDDLGEESAAVLAQRRRSLVPDPLVFNATTDLGIATLYAVDVTPDNPAVTAAIASATDADPDRALAKVLREGAVCRTGLNRTTRKPRLPHGPHDLADGAIWMAQRKHLDRFDFLRQTPRRSSMSELPNLHSPDPRETFRRLCGRLHAAGMEILVVEITPDELRSIGFRAVRVIVPQLVPLTFSLDARFLAHPRITDADQRLGYPQCHGNGVNPDPQPLA